MSGLHVIPFFLYSLVYFFGDLNYRIELDISTVKELIRLQEYAKLHDYDEVSLPFF